MGTAWGPPKLIALDIDGTIIDAGRPVSPRVRAGVRAAVDSGTHLVLATGRSVFNTLPVLAELGLTTGSVVCSNGAVRVDAATGEFLTVHRFEAGPVVASLSAVLPGAAFAVERLGMTNLLTGVFPYDDPGDLVDVATLVAQPVTRLTMWWDGHTSAELAAVLEGVGLDGVQWMVDRSGPWFVAVPTGVTKGTALEELRLELGVPADATLAVGDGDNDVEMLRWAACGVAMGHAPDSVKAAAHEVTGTFDDDGLAAVLERWYA